jgi:hypothetical protein
MLAHELPIPPAALDDANARELVRVWAASGKQHLSLAAGLWSDPAAWGILLVDLARHIARAYDQAQGLERDSALVRIRKGMDAEWSDDTDADRLGGLQFDSE